MPLQYVRNQMRSVILNIELALRVTFVRSFHEREFIFSTLEGMKHLQGPGYLLNIVILSGCDILKEVSKSKH